MTEPERLFFVGGAHARATHVLLAAAKSNVHMTVPFYLLMGFALELLLKAAYLHLGGDAKVAKHDIHHDLPKALKSLENIGFKPENAQLGWLTDTMAEVHRDNSFRYLKAEGDLKVADESIGLQIVDDLLIQVGQMLYPEHDRDYWIEGLTTFESKEITERA